MSERELERIRRNVEMAGWTDPDDIFRLIKENTELREEVELLREGYTRTLQIEQAENAELRERIENQEEEESRCFKGYPDCNCLNEYYESQDTENQKEENGELRKIMRDVVHDSVWMPSEDHPEDTIIAYLDKAGWENLIASFSPKEEKEEG